ncbi:hypothetical protein ACIPWE_40290 [Streptomyces sp. NPDC090073]|uniref:hypothetical protein n=1 Tax=Streptomyces sp. NPDC090073 TaxID=3365936 RepID=UPI00382B7978
MTGNEPKKPRRAAVLGVAAVVALAYVATRRDDESVVNVPPGAAGWHGAMSLYRNLAVWAGRRALEAEMHYWKAVG